uniref:Solute carrier family 40 member n=1 Tax=Equus caballus TaxID=9796 RepID=A0A5F5PMT9_HORSE
MIKTCFASTAFQGDGMWHFAMSVLLTELYTHNLLTAVFGLVVAGSVLIFGVLICDWIDRKPRNKVNILSIRSAYASLFTEDASVTSRCVVLMLDFSYKREMQQVWHSWFYMCGACSAAVITLVALVNLLSTALIIVIRRDWIVSFTGDNRGQLAEMNATIQRLDQIINIFTPLPVGRVMTRASHVIGCGFILGWNLVSLPVEFLFLHRGNWGISPPSLVTHWLRVVSGGVDFWALTARFHVPVSGERPSGRQTQVLGIGSHRCTQELSNKEGDELLHTCHQGWETYCRQTVFSAALGLALLSMAVLGFNCITTSYAYTQGIRSSLLGILIALSALSGLMGTILLTRFRGHYSLVTMGIISSWLLMLCMFSVFAPCSPFDLAQVPFRFIPSRIPNDPGFGGVAKLSHRKLHLPNSTMPVTAKARILTEVSDIYLHLFSRHCCPLLQENIPEAKQGAVNCMHCSLNHIMDLIYFILDMQALRPQQFGMLVFIAILFVTMGHVLYFFFYARKCKITNAHAQKTVKKGTST